MFCTCIAAFTKSSVPQYFFSVYKHLLKKLFVIGLNNIVLFIPIAFPIANSSLQIRGKYYTLSWNWRSRWLIYNRLQTTNLGGRADVQSRDSQYLSEG